MILRRARLATTLLLVLSAFIASAVPNNLFPPVQAVAPSISLSPTFGPYGLEVFFSGSGFSTLDLACVVTGQHLNRFHIVTKGACTVNQFGTTTTTATGASVSLQGSFTVGNATSGQYVIQVNATAAGGAQQDFAEAVFFVTYPPRILALYGKGVTPGPPVPSGPIGIHVNFNVSQLYGGDAACSVSSPGSGLVTSGACAIVPQFQPGGGNGTYANATGSFTVGNVLPGQYIVQVAGSACQFTLGCDFAQAIFNVTLGPKITLHASPGPGVVHGLPESGPAGTHVNVYGTGFLPDDATCSITGPGSGIVTAAACVKVLGSTTVNGSFTVGNVIPGQYIVQVNGNLGDFAQAIFNVTLGPSIILTPATGPVGIHVNFSGVGFLPTDTTCAVTSPGSGLVIGAACVKQSGSTTVTGSFSVGNVLPGQYIVQVTGQNGGDFAQAIFNVTRGPIIQLAVVNVYTPVGQVTSGPVGIHVNIQGTFFVATDTTCTISSPTSASIIVGAACTFFVPSSGPFLGFKNATGSFTVGNVLPGQYIIQVTGNQGDFAQAIFNVTLGPSITLTPPSGTIGDHISFHGTGFLPTDITCTVTSGSSNAFNPILPGSQACVTRLGTGIVDGSFIIANVPPGQYVIQVTGNVGDYAQAILTVTAVGSTLILNPTNATNAATVTFRGTGFSASDTGCVVESVVETSPGVYSPKALLITSPTCSIVTPGTAQGSFVVGPFATTNINWTLQVRGTPVNDIPARAVFNVTASVLVTPPSGTRNTVFTFTGSGFSSVATSCQAHIYPPFPTVPPTLPPACYLSTSLGQVGGSVVTPGSVVSGTYAINVGDNKGHNATGFFTVGTPSALIVLTPGTVAQSQPVAVSGVGFNPNDTFCVVTSGGSAGTPPWAGAGGVAPICSISGGYASASFTVSNTANGGYYLITLTGWGDFHKNNVTGGDFASNFMGVNLASTVTTFTPTTTTTTTGTLLSTTTTSVATSYTYYSTTYSTTGLSITSYTHLTVNTVSGLTTTIITQTSSTTQTQTTVTVTTTTQFTTAACSALPCPYALGSQATNSGPFADEFGLLAVLLLIVPMLLRRLFQ